MALVEVVVPEVVVMVTVTRAQLGMEPEAPRSNMGPQKPSKDRLGMHLSTSAAPAKPSAQPTKQL